MIRRSARLLAIMAAVTVPTLLCCANGSAPQYLRTAGGLPSASAAASADNANRRAPTGRQDPRATQPSTPPSAATLALDGTAPKVDSSSINRGGLEGLRAALADVTHIELVTRGDAVQRKPIAPSDQARILDMLRSARIAKLRTAAHPPWPAVLWVHTRRHGPYAVTLVGFHSLRLDERLLADTRPHQSPEWQEMQLAGEDYWLWQYFEARLGPTQQKEYQAVPPPKQPIDIFGD